MVFMRISARSDSRLVMSVESIFLMPGRMPWMTIRNYRYSSSGFAWMVSVRSSAAFFSFSS
jgi:hypothetical protein